MLVLPMLTCMPQIWICLAYRSLTFSGLAQGAGVAILVLSQDDIGFPMSQFGPKNIKKIAEAFL